MQYPSHFVPVYPLTKDEVATIMVKVFKFLLRKTNYAIYPPFTLAILCFNYLAPLMQPDQWRVIGVRCCLVTQKSAFLV